MLIAFGGLPGTGKTTLAKELAHRLSALYLRIDSIEQAIVGSAVLSEVGPAGYFVGYAIAADNLRIGSTVVADSVNPLAVTRDAWRDVARAKGVRFAEIELICSDPVEHRRRVEHRMADIPDHKLPECKDVLDRQFDVWNREHIVIDTATVSVLDAVDELIRRLSEIAE